MQKRHLEVDISRLNRGMSNAEERLEHRLVQMTNLKELNKQLVQQNEILTGSLIEIKKDARQASSVCFVCILQFMD